MNVRVRPRPLHLAAWMSAVLLPVLLLAFGSLHAPTATAQYSATVMVSQNATLGSFLTDSQGMTLYTFMRDTAGMSACSGGCATTWPPLQPPSGDLSLPQGVGGALTAISRDDGSQQVAYNGMPLYRYARDQQPGDTSGQGVGGVWFVAAPQQ